MKNLASLLATALLLTSLSGCSWASQTISDLLPSCENKVYTVASGLVASGNIAHGYTGLPLCGSPKALPGNLCSDISVIRTIKSAKDTAYTAVKAAEKACTETTYQAALTAATAYGDIAKIFSPPQK